MKKLGVVIAALLLISARPLSAQDRFSLSGDRVAIYNLAGEVRLEPTSEAAVVVEVSRGGADGDRLELRRSEAGGWQQLIVHYPERRVVYQRLGRFSRSQFGVRDDGTFGLRNLDPAMGAERIKGEARSVDGGARVQISGSGNGLEAHADLRVLVPEGHAVAVHLGVGKIVLSNVRGEFQIDARSGSIEGEQVRGMGRFDTGSGAISLRHGTGDFGLHTGSGAIRVENVEPGALVVSTGSGGVEAGEVNASELAINTGSGSVTLRSVSAPVARVVTGSGGIRAQALAARNFDIQTGSGSVRVELLRDVQTGRIETGSGSVQVAVSNELGAEVMVDTGSGGINVDAARIDISEKRRSYLKGRIGDGDGTLQVSTGSGGVSFRSF